MPARELCAPAPLQGELLDPLQERVAHHSYSVGVMVLFLRMTVWGAVGFRGAASALGFVADFLGTDELVVSANGGQIWVLRVGLYELLRAKEKADDWIWIVDHTIQVGKGKCFVVVGIRIAALTIKRLDKYSSGALTCQDLSVWEIEVVESSDGPIVAGQLNDLSKRTGQVPREILSDCGGDLSAGIAQFCEEHPETIAVKDLPHFAANAIKKELKDDSQWAAYLADANSSKTQLRQTKFAFLLPPDLKTKARWMNLDPLITWSEKALQFVTSPQPVPGVTWEDEELQEKMGWILKYRTSLRSWAEMLEVVAASLKYIRKQGYHQHARDELKEVLSPLPASNSHARRVADRILDYVMEQSQNVSEGEHLLATTEVLESLLGKAKQLHGQQSRSGFTKMVLGIAANVSHLTATAVKNALSTISVSNLWEWVNQEIGPSVQAQRIHAFTPHRAEQK